MNRKRKCKFCGNYTANFIKVPAGSFCDMDHAVKFAMDQKEKIVKRKQLAQKRKEKKQAQATRAKYRAEKEAARPRSWYVKDAQKWFNKFIRLRDASEPCICCGREASANIQWHAGHLLTTGARPEHRFNEDNCHKQTSYCNNHLSGNVAEYRKRLIIKIGLDRVEAMEQDYSPKKYNIDELKEITATYKAKCKELQNHGQ